MFSRPVRVLFSLTSMLLTAHTAQAQTYHAGAGLTLTGTTFSVANGGVTGAMIGLPLSLSASSSSPILTVTNTGSGYGIKTVSTSGTGTYGTNTKYGNVGTLGDINGFGVYGSTTSGPYAYGVYGINRASGNGDYGFLGGVEPVSGSKYPVGVFGSDTASFGFAVLGNSAKGIGILGNTTGSNEVGVLGYSSSAGIDHNGKGVGVEGLTGSGTGGYFASSSGIGVAGVSTSGDGGFFSSSSGTGVYGKNGGNGDSGFLGGDEPVTGNQYPVGVYGSDTSSFGYALFGNSTNGIAVVGNSTGRSGVYGVSSSSGLDGQGSGNGVYGLSGAGDAIFGYTISGKAGYFEGDVTVTGTLTAGAKNFKIDHPLDPEHKYLYHASVESSEMKDIYDGTVVVDAAGTATVALPDWFQALNTDFRYQLTAIGAPGPNLYIAQEIAGNKFQIAGGTPGMKVSWQVTGVRHDAFALAHPMQVEQGKPENEQGLYQNPDAFGQPEDKGIGYQHRLKTGPAHQP